MARLPFQIDWPLRRHRLSVVLVAGFAVLSSGPLRGDEPRVATASTATAKKPDADPVGAAGKRLDISAKLSEILAKKYPESIEDLRAIQVQTARVLEQVMPATVGLQINSSSGSGVIVRSDGLILTAGHVAGRPGRDVMVLLADGKRARGKTLGTNHSVDSGMIQITDEGPWPYAPLAKADEIGPGQWVVATGHPGGYRPNRSPPVRLGRVLFMNEDVICTDCTLVGGDSGGPLFNMRGEVVAIHSRIGRSITSNFHVPIAAYHTTWDRLEAGEMWGGQPPKDQEQAKLRPFLGIHLDGRQVRPMVAQVDPNTPAARAGIQIGDVVLAFDEQTVTSRAELTERLLGKRPNQRVKLRLERDGKPIEIEMTLGAASLKIPGGPLERLPDENGERKTPNDGSPEGAKPPAPKKSPNEAPPKSGPPKEPSKDEPSKEAPNSPKKPPVKSPPDDGKSMPPRTADADSLCTVLGIEIDRASRRCIVARVLPGSRAALAGIRSGDVIIRVGGRTIHTPTDMQGSIAGQASAGVEISLLRSGREIKRMVRRVEK